MNGRFVLLPLLFFGSGASALAYEVVWIRLLGLSVCHDRPGAKHDVASAIFARKVRELAPHKRSARPHLRGVEAAGLTREEAGQRIRMTLEKLPVH